MRQNLFPTLRERLIRPRNYIQERPTQIYAYYVLYTVGGMKTNPVPLQKLKGKNYSSDVILQYNKKQVNISG